ncbi:MAG: tetratricopeptide repeat protein [Deltaproteobacteria bacterium]|nr:tetratricopeptide repeat protein [Deltaproteobacteria bacterium]
MKSKVLILILIYVFLGIFFCPQIALTEINDIQYLHILKESGQRQKAYEGYKSAIAKYPGSIPLTLNFIELLIDMGRIDEAWNRLEKIEPEDINILNDDDQRRIALLRAQIFVRKEEFSKAITEIEPFADSKDDQLLIADIYLLGGQRNKSLRILKDVTRSSYYTPYEKDLARKKIKDIKRYYASRFSMDSGIVDSIPWSTISGMVPIGQNGQFTTSYLWMDGGQLFSVALDCLHKRFPPTESYELLFSITDDGDEGVSVKKTFYPTKRSQAEIKGYYNQVEREITALMDEFSLKKGGSLRFDYAFSDMLTGSCKYEYSDYHLYSDYRQGYMNIFNIGATIDQHLSVKKIVLYHTVNMLVIEGHEEDGYKEDVDKRVYIAKHFYMPSYTFRLSYPVSDEYSDYINFKIGLGSFWAEDHPFYNEVNEDKVVGFVFSPGFSFNLHVHRNVSIRGGAEYRMGVHRGLVLKKWDNDCELRTNVGVHIIF